MFKYAFRKGEGDYIHLQGPAPQQLEHDIPTLGHYMTSKSAHFRAAFNLK